VRGPIRWWRERLDPFRDLEPYEFPSTERLEETTELRDPLEEIFAAYSRGGPDEGFRAARQAARAMA
jgi:hypothetical protein